MTNTVKYSLGALAFIILLFLYNQNSQKSNTATGEAIFSGQQENVARIVISENDKLIELSGPYGKTSYEYDSNGQKIIEVDFDEFDDFQSKIKFEYKKDR